MEPAKLDDRELGCIDYFLFCCLLSSGLVWPKSWAILAPSWLHLGPSWLHLGPFGLHLGSPKPPEACPDLTRLSPEALRGAQRRPEPKSYKQAQRSPNTDRDFSEICL